MRYKHFYEPVYQASVHYVYDCGHEEANKKFKRIFGIDGHSTEKHGGQCVEAINKSGNTEQFIYTRKKDFYTLLHEIVHMVHHILTRRNVPITETDSEAYAYYIEYWARVMWRNTK